jgi:hypothetical protein
MAFAEVRVEKKVSASEIGEFNWATSGEETEGRPFI